MRILVVDGDDLTRRVYAQVLRRAGHEVVLAEAPSVARRVLDAGGAIDVVVTGIGFAEGDAWDAMKDMVRRFGVRVIAATGCSTQQDFGRSEECGFSAHLTKPIDAQQLLSTIAFVGWGRELFRLPSP